MLHKKVPKLLYNNLASWQEKRWFSLSWEPTGSEGVGGASGPGSLASTEKFNLLFLCWLRVGAFWCCPRFWKNHATVAIILTWTWTEFLKSLPLLSDASLKVPDEAPLCKLSFQFTSQISLCAPLCLSSPMGLKKAGMSWAWEWFIHTHSHAGDPLRANEEGHILYKVAYVKSNMDNLLNVHICPEWRLCWLCQALYKALHRHFCTESPWQCYKTGLIISLQISKPGRREVN